MPSWDTRPPIAPKVQQKEESHGSPGRPPGILDKRQVLASVDAAIDNLKRLRELVEQAFDQLSGKKP